tara:strand:- start:2889 stop:3341 length:453 start_codon:yes stop_codon:yes gene_type:complete
MSKKQWGNACWYLFHTLAEKIKPEYTGDIELIKNLIINVCFNLPCPICSTHARNNLSKIPTRNITTKEELKRFLWILHNRVNKQLHKPQLSYEACNRFKYARTGRMVEYFKYNMLRYSGQLRMAITNRNKNMHVKNILNYLYTNAYKFNP